MKLTRYFTPYYLIQIVFKKRKNKIAPLSLALMNAASKYYLAENSAFLDHFVDLESKIAVYPEYRTLLTALQRFNDHEEGPTGGQSDFDNDASLLLGVIPFALYEFSMRGPSAIHNLTARTSLKRQIEATHNTPRAHISAFFYFGLINSILRARRLNNDEPLVKEQVIAALDEGILDVTYQLRAYKYHNVMQYFVRLDRGIFAKNNIIKPSVSIAKIKKSELVKSNYVVEALEVMICGLIHSHDEASLLEFIYSLPGEGNLGIAPALALAALAYEPTLPFNEEVLQSSTFDNALMDSASIPMNEMIVIATEAAITGDDETCDDNIALFYSEYCRRGFPLISYDEFYFNALEAMKSVIDSFIKSQLN